MAVCVLVLGLVQGSSVAQSSSDGERGAGTEDRQWVEGPADPPESMSPQQYAVRTEAAVIEMEDGALLDARLFLPVRLPSEDPGPCVLTADGYGPPSAIGPLTFALTGESLNDLATRGYAGAHVFLQTRDVPEDQAFYYKYSEHGYQLVEWMADQPWCDGNVGMIGPSLLGISQWLTAKADPPHLRAIIPEIGCGDCYWYLWYRGGMLPGDGREGRQPPVTAYDEYGAAIEHRNYDAWWRERDTTSADFERIARSDIAVMQCGGWDDYIYSGGVKAVQEVVAAGGHGMQIIGPCSHGGSTYDLLPYDLQTFRVLWFDRFLKGIENGIDEGPEALFYVEGAEQYRFEDEWPIPDAHTTTLYLRAEKSHSAPSLNNGSLTADAPADDEPAVSYDYSPDGPYNNAGGSGARPTEDQRGDEEHSLTWTTPPLDVATEVTGWPRVRLWASSTATDTDFVVELTDVAPDGTSTQVARGWLNAPRSFNRANPPELTPGEVHKFEITVWPMSYVFPEGHRIRLALSSSDNPGTAPNPHAAMVTVHQDAEHPSQLELPVVGTSWQALEEEPGSETVAGPAEGGAAAPEDSQEEMPATGNGLPLGLAVAFMLAAIMLLTTRRHPLLGSIGDSRPLTR